MNHRYKLIDMQTFEPVAAYDAMEEIERVLKYDLEHNGPDSVRNLELFVGTGEFPESSLCGDELLKLAVRLTSAPVTPISPTRGTAPSKRAGR